MMPLSPKYHPSGLDFCSLACLLIARIPNNQISNFINGCELGPAIEEEHLSSNPTEWQAAERCGHCGLNQFVSVRGTCRRCHRSLGVEYFSIPLAMERAMVSTRESLAIEIGLLLRELRRRRGASQTLCASEVGVHRTQLSRIERGHICPSVRLLLKLAGVFGVDRLVLRVKRDKPSKCE